MNAINGFCEIVYFTSELPDVLGLLMSLGWVQRMQVATVFMGWANEERLKRLRPIQATNPHDEYLLFQIDA